MGTRGWRITSAPSRPHGARGPDQLTQYIAGRDAASYTLTNVTLLARPWRACGCELSGSVYNLFRTRYADPGGQEHTQDLIPQDGRTFRLGARASF